jgi:hypothetical protein
MVRPTRAGSLNPNRILMPLRAVLNKSSERCLSEIARETAIAPAVAETEAANALLSGMPAASIQLARMLTSFPEHSG